MELFLERREVPSLFECGKEEQGDVGVLSLVCNRGEGGDEYAPALFSSWEEPGYKANCTLLYKLPYMHSYMHGLAPPIFSTQYIRLRYMYTSTVHLVGCLSGFSGFASALLG